MHSMPCVRSKPLRSTLKLRDQEASMRYYMTDPRDWRMLLAAAMLEGDITQMPLRIEKAEEAIHARIRELPQKFFVGHEQAELQLALQNLRLLKARRLRAA